MKDFHCGDKRSVFLCGGSKRDCYDGKEISCEMRTVGEVENEETAKISENGLEKNRRDGDGIHREKAFDVIILFIRREKQCSINHN